MSQSILKRIFALSLDEKRYLNDHFDRIVESLDIKTAQLNPEQSDFVQPEEPVQEEIPQENQEQPVNTGDTYSIVKYIIERMIGAGIAVEYRVLAEEISGTIADFNQRYLEVENTYKKDYGNALITVIEMAFEQYSMSQEFADSGYAEIQDEIEDFIAAMPPVTASQIITPQAGTPTAPEEKQVTPEEEVSPKQPDEEEDSPPKNYDFGMGSDVYEEPQDGLTKQIFNGLMPIPVFLNKDQNRLEAGVIVDGKPERIDMGVMNQIYDVISTDSDIEFSRYQNNPDAYTESYTRNIIHKISGIVRDNDRGMNEASSNFFDDVMRNLPEILARYQMQRHPSGEGYDYFDSLNLEALDGDDFITSDFFNGVKKTTDLYNRQLDWALNESRELSGEGSRMEEDKAASWPKAKYFCAKCNKFWAGTRSTTLNGRTVMDENAEPEHYTSVCISPEYGINNGDAIAPGCQFTENMIRERTASGAIKDLMEADTPLRITAGGVDIQLKGRGEEDPVTGQSMDQPLTAHEGHVNGINNMINSHIDRLKASGIAVDESEFATNIGKLMSASAKMIPHFWTKDAKPWDFVDDPEEQNIVGDRKWDFENPTQSQIDRFDTTLQFTEAVEYLSPILTQSLDWESRNDPVISSLFADLPEDEAEERRATAISLNRYADLFQFINSLPSKNAVGNIYKSGFLKYLDETGQKLPFTGEEFSTTTNESELATIMAVPEAMGRKQFIETYNKVVDEIGKRFVDKIKDDNLEGKRIPKAVTEKYKREIFSDILGGIEIPFGTPKSVDLQEVTRKKELEKSIQEARSTQLTPEEEANVLEMEKEAKDIQDRIDASKKVNLNLIGANLMSPMDIIELVETTVDIARLTDDYMPDPDNPKFSIKQSDFEELSSYEEDSPAHWLVKGGDANAYLNPTTKEEEPPLRLPGSRKTERRPVEVYLDDGRRTMIKRDNSFPEDVEAINTLSTLPRTMRWAVASMTDSVKDVSLSPDMDEKGRPVWESVNEKGERVRVFSLSDKIDDLRERFDSLNPMQKSFLERLEKSFKSGERYFVDDFGKRFSPDKVDQKAYPIEFQKITGPLGSRASRQALKVLGLGQAAKDANNFNAANVWSLVSNIKNGGRMNDRNKGNGLWSPMPKPAVEGKVPFGVAPPAVKIGRLAGGVQIGKYKVMSPDGIDSYNPNYDRPGINQFDAWKRRGKQTQKGASKGNWYRLAQKKSDPKKYNYVIITSNYDVAIMAKNAYMGYLDSTQKRTMPYLKVVPFSNFGSLEAVAKFSTDLNNMFRAIAISEDLELTLKKIDMWPGTSQ